LDVVLFSVGALFAFIFAANWRTIHLWIDFGMFLYLAWALVLVATYGKDLIRVVQKR